MNVGRMYPVPAEVATRNKHHQQNYNIYSRMEDSNTLGEGKISVGDPILDKISYDREAGRHDPSTILLDNDFLSEEDKKVFILNYRLLSKTKELHI